MKCDRCDKENLPNIHTCIASIEWLCVKENECFVLEDMLVRVLEEIEYQEPGIVLDDDVKEWYLKYKASL